MISNFLEKLNISKDTFYLILAILYVSVFIFSAYIIGFNIFIYLFCFAGVALLIFIKPNIGLYLIIFCTVVYERFFTLNPIVLYESVYKFYPLDLVLIITFFVLFLKQDLFRKFFQSYKNNKLLYISWFVFACILLLNFGRTILAGGDLTIAVSVVKNYLFYSSIYILVINLITDHKKYNKLIAVLLSAVLFVLGIFLVGLITGQEFLTEFIPLSTYGARYLGGGHSFFVAIMIILLFNYLIFNRRVIEKWPMYADWIIFAFCLIAITLSLLRHLWLGLLLIILFLFIFYKKKQKIKLVKILLITIVIGLIGVSLLVVLNKWQQSTGVVSTDLLAGIKSRANSIINLNFNDESALWRKESWSAAIIAWQKQPIFGLGLGSNIYVDLFDFESEIQARDLHNDFVGILVQTGLIGFLAFIWFVFEIFKKFIISLKKAAFDQRMYLLESAGVILLFLFSANFGTYFDINLLVVFLWIFLGVMINYKKIAQ